MIRAARACSLVLAVAAMALLAAGCGDDDSSTDSDARATDPAAATTTADEQDSVDAPAAGDAIGGELAPIVVTSPKLMATVVDSMVLEGTAQVFEATLNWAILDANQKPLKRGHITASCGAPCRGDFRQKVSLKGVPLGSWELHVWEPNAAGEGADPDAGPARLHDVMIPITVSDQQIEGAPEPDAFPPGGTPE